MMTRVCSAARLASYTARVRWPHPPPHAWISVVLRGVRSARGHIIFECVVRLDERLAVSFGKVIGGEEAGIDVVVVVIGVSVLIVPLAIWIVDLAVLAIGAADWRRPIASVRKQKPDAARAFPSGRNHFAA